MLKYDFEESLGYWTILTAQSYQRALNEELAPHGVTFRQSQVLAWLALEGELSQVELAGRMMIEPPTLVGVLDRMERDGWISRTGCVADRRKKLIRVNPAAEKIWEKVAACARNVRSRAGAGLSSEEMRTLRTLLQRVKRNLDEPADLLEKSA